MLEFTITHRVSSAPNDTVAVQKGYEGDIVLALWLLERHPLQPIGYIHIISSVRQPRSVFFSYSSLENHNRGLVLRMAFYEFLWRVSILVVWGQFWCTGVAGITTERCWIHWDTEIDCLIMYKHLSGTKAILMYESRWNHYREMLDPVRYWNWPVGNLQASQWYESGSDVRESLILLRRANRSNGTLKLTGW